MADTRTARRQPQAAWYSRFMVSASSAWVPALAPAGQGPPGAPKLLSVRAKSIRPASRFSLRENACTAQSAAPLRGAPAKAPIPSPLTCLIQLFHSQRVLRLGACACPSGPRPAGGPGPFICTGELNSPGIKVFPSGKRLYGAKRRPAPAPAKAPHPLTSDMPDTVFS